MSDRRSWGAAASAPLLSRRFRVVFGLAITADPIGTLKALASMVRGRRVRGWNLLSLAAARHAKAYARWIERVEPTLVARYGKTVSQTLGGTSITVLIFGDGTEDAAQVHASARSAEAAFGKDISVMSFVHGGEAAVGHINLAEALGAVSTPWILAIRAGDRLSPHLGGVLSSALQRHATADIIFWDEDEWGSTGRGRPWLKGVWDDFLFQTCDTLSGASLIALPSLRAAAQLATAARCDERGFSAIMAQMAGMAGLKAEHIPVIMTHRVASRPFLRPETLRVSPEEASVAPPPQGRWPAISIVVPTRDQADLLRACLSGLDRLDYGGDLELIIVDNGSTDPAALAVLADYRDNGTAHVLERPGPFNFSALINDAVHAARGEYLCLLNNDVEPLDGHWLCTMVRHGMGERVGAVGCKLLYPDRSLQHGGVAIGVGGAAGHVNKGADGANEWRRTWGDSNRKVSAVTAACMVVRKDRFMAVGGLDAERFPIAFNDVDLCLKLADAGFQNLYVADAQLIHHESKSRGTRLSGAAARHFAAELLALQTKWKTIGYADPHYSPLFLPTAEQCVLGF